MAEEVFDLDQAAPDRPPWAFTYRGERFELPGEMGGEVLIALGEFGEALITAREAKGEAAGLEQMAAMAKLGPVLRELFPTEADYERFTALRPPQSAILALLGEVSERGMGADLGEASPPAGSSVAAVAS